LDVAFHETGHCLFQESFGIEVSSVSGVPSGDRPGSLGFVFSNMNRIALPVELHLIHFLAGGVASHRIVSADLFNPRAFYLPSGDAGVIQKIADAVCPTPKEAISLILRCAAHTYDLIQLPQTQRWLRALAIELYVKERISGDEVREVLRQNGFYEKNNPLIQFGLEMKDKTVGEIALGLLDLSALEQVSGEV